MTHVVTADGLDELITALRDDGRTIIGPQARDGVITHDVIDSATELPRGWTEEQNGGRYQLQATGTDERFAYSSPSTSWKRFLYPERTLMLRATRDNGKVQVDIPEPDAPSVAFFGIRSCDLAALGILDRVFLDPDATDPTYAARRPDVFIVAVGCNNPGNTCFCVSMDTGPSPTSGFDLAISELVDDDGVRYLVESGSDRGAELLAGISSKSATDADHARAATAQEHAVASMGRELRSDLVPLAALDADHPRWDDVAERCLACGNCTMVCPTCFCSTTEESTSLTGAESERWRVWDSCYSLEFSHMHGGSARTSIKSRYRQWLLHKLVTWQDQFDSSGCVGCGRCITWCPVGIDLTAEIAALAVPATERSNEGVEA
ncbi:MAG: 4Fe-4S dicluster domain-containing protein [Acidimicrobiales bacterium]|nr:4Fe-4S dicluster domain-containing protein [Acidimicrobiales bacterium]